MSQVSSGLENNSAGHSEEVAGLPRSRKYMENDFFQVREFCGWSGKFIKDLESQEKVREFENKWLWQADFRKFIYSFQVGKMYFLVR